MTQRQTQTTPFFKGGDRISLACLPPKRRGRQRAIRSVRGKVVYIGENFLTVQHQPAGWRECFLLTDIREGLVKLVEAGS